MCDVRSERSRWLALGVALWLACAACFWRVESASADPAGQPYGACAWSSVTVTAPANGASLWTMRTVAAGKYDDVASVMFLQTTSATAGTRTDTFRIQDGAGHTLWSVTGLVGPSLVQRYSFGAAASPFTNDYDSALPQMTLQPGWVVNMAISGAAAGDVLASGAMSVCEGSSALDPGVVVNNFPTVAVTTTSSTTVGPAVLVGVSGFTGDGLAVPVALGFLVFGTCYSVVVSWRFRRE